jgi:hypothetical protein
MEDQLLALYVSAKTAKQHFSEVVIYCNQWGKGQLQKHRLDFSFAKIDTSLEKCPYYTNEQWSLSKVFIYSLQTEPFIHSDIDAFMWGGIPEALLEKRFIFQNFEPLTHKHYGFYKKTHEIAKRLGLLPEPVQKLPRNSFNMGIFGVLRKEDLYMMAQYLDASSTYIKNQQEFCKLSKFTQNAASNCMAEQLFITSILDNNGVTSDEISTICNYEMNPNPGIKYKHYTLGLKRGQDFINLLKSKLKDL